MGVDVGEASDKGSEKLSEGNHGSSSGREQLHCCSKRRFIESVVSQRSCAGQAVAQPDADK